MAAGNPKAPSNYIILSSKILEELQTHEATLQKYTNSCTTAAFVDHTGTLWVQVNAIRVQLIRAVFLMPAVGTMLSLRTRAAPIHRQKIVSPVLKAVRKSDEAQSAFINRAKQHGTYAFISEAADRISFIMDYIQPDEQAAQCFPRRTDLV